MPSGITAKIISACCGLSAFSIAIVAGMSVNNPFEDIVLRAIFSLFAGYAVGIIVGSIAEKTVADALVVYKTARPIDAEKNNSVRPRKTEDASVVAMADSKT